MKAIARACKVSSMTVSRALRTDSVVASKTQQRIRTMAQQAGYRLNGKIGRPRQVADSPLLTVEIVIGTSIGGGNLYHARLVVAIEQELSKRHCDCLIRTCGDNYDQFLLLCDALRRTKPRHLLIVGYFPTDRLQSLLALTAHPILVDQTARVELTGPYECIGFDNVEAAHLAVRHLLDNGRRRILLIKGPKDHYFSRQIEQGYREVLRERREAVNEALIVTADFTAKGARQVVADTLAAGISFDAVFTNDEMAMGVLRALHEARVPVPKQVAVAGCDGLPAGLYTIPSLTTVMLDYDRLGQMTVEHLFARERTGEPACRIQLLPTLVVRESTGGTDGERTPGDGKRKQTSNIQCRIKANAEKQSLCNQKSAVNNHP